MNTTEDKQANNADNGGTPRTFMLWELAVVYRRLGLAAPLAERAAIADLRMLHESALETQCQAA